MRIVVSCSAVAMLLTSALRADWPQFRGPNSAGVADGSTVPIEFGPGKHELWSLPFNSGHSSPCIAGDSIFLTTFDTEREKLEVVCIARDKGTIRWRRHVPTGEIETGHPSFNPASSTPASDGERVVAYFGSFGLICFDMGGEKLWDIEMPLAKSYAGNATSPAIVGDRVILYRGNHIDHFLLAVDKETGKQLWKVKQDEPFASELACTACPIVANDKLIVHTASRSAAATHRVGRVVAPYGDANDSAPCIVLSVTMKSGEKITEMGGVIRAKLEQTKQTLLPRDIDIAVVSDQPTVVAHKIGNFMANVAQAIVRHITSVRR